MSLNRQQVVLAAIALLDEGGLEAVTFRKIADRLGVQSPTLFWHVKNKAALLTAMAEAILEPEFTDIAPLETGQRWQDWLIDLATRLRRTLLAHRDGARVLSMAQLSVTMATISDTAIRTLVEQGVALRDARLTVLAVERFTQGQVLEEQAPRPEEGDLTDFDLAAFSRKHPTIIAAVTDYFRDGRTVDTLFHDILRIIVD